MSNELVQIDLNLNNARDIVDKVFMKYKDDPYMTSRIYNYIYFQFPCIIDNMKKEHDERVQRIEDLTNEQLIFVQNFQSNYRYFFVPATEHFFLYDGMHYKMVNEDDVLYHILTLINQDRTLICWKQKTKQHIMKKIKENNLLTSVPESDTIQFVLDTLCPAFFDTRDEAKYFLCVLGDNILRKQGKTVHLIDQKSKKFISELNNICQVYVGANLSTSFRFKYHEHEYSDCRLFRISETVKFENVWGSILSTPSLVLNLICVACHYSIRYDSSDEFLTNLSSDKSIYDYVFYLKNHTHESLVDHFVHNYLHVTIFPIDMSATSIDSSSNKIDSIQITWKDMQYLWKQFLDKEKIPTVLFQSALKTILKTKFSENYNEPNDSFLGLYSTHLPVIQRFLDFWAETIAMDVSEMAEYEIGELCFLFKKWAGENNKVSITEKQMFDLITCFFPDIAVERNKYVQGITCSLWNKQIDVQIGIDNYKIMMETDTHNSMEYVSPNASRTSLNTMVNQIAPNFSVYDAYVYYCKYISNLYKSHEQIVSKQYFEKYIAENLIVPAPSSPLQHYDPSHNGF